jgi:hypothetical protein
MRRLHYGWVVAGITWFTLLAAAGFRSTPAVLIVPLQHEFGWSRATISIAVSINLMLFGLFAPFAGGLMERFGVRRVVVGALLTVSAGSGLTIFMNQPCVFEPQAIVAGRVLRANDRPPRTPAHGAALVGDNAEEPGLEIRAGPEVCQLAPRLDGGLLHHVLSLGVVLQHRVREPGGRPDRRAQQILEGGLLPHPRPRDQLWIAWRFHTFVTPYRG